MRIFIVVLIALNSHFLQAQTSVRYSLPEEIIEKHNEPIQPIPKQIFLNTDIVTLGEKLFHDPRLSKGNKLACSNCHQLQNGGDDNLPVSITNQNKPDLINSPTVFNSVFNFRQTWRGAFKTLELQAEGDLRNPRHGATTWQELLPKLKAEPLYKADFDKLYDNGITRENVLNAMATYEASLITPNSRFDKFLRGNDEAITDEEKQGYKLFKRHGCIACHQGVNVGGNVFQKFGLFGDYFAERGNIKKADYGLYNVTGLESDRFTFRVPSLRNVAVTAPYLHDGSQETLLDVVQVMARFQLGASIQQQNAEKIVAFLKTLTGEYRGRSLEVQQ